MFANPCSSSSYFYFYTTSPPDSVNIMIDNEIIVNHGGLFPPLYRLDTCFQYHPSCHRTNQCAYSP